MVIASNEWINYDDDQKQSQMIETNVLMMAAPSPVQRSVVSATSAAPATAVEETGAPNAVINTITVEYNGTTTIINCDSAECESLDSLARIVLICQPDSHPFQTRTILLAPNIECKVGRCIAKSKASDSNAIFDCKVLSRNHAVLWYSSDGKFYVKDTKSSNGTFINERKIPASEPVELNFGDVVKFGVEVMENSRKEVHGCIIASVKPYLPDGREAISISQLGQSTFRSDSRISFEELHRLNLYMQETSQREKLLKAKLQNIQNILDATRKNTTICWQSMIDEDRLLNRIHLLENKLQFLQKNSPPDQLKEEILKLQDEKFVYQNSAKEALRKVYQERMDAMQKLSKMEHEYTISEDDRLLLRDQVQYTRQTLQDVHSRLLRLETEYSEYKDQMEKCQRETNEEQSNFDATAADLADKLKERETECEEYKKKIGELLLTRAEQLDLDEESRKEKFVDENVVDALSTANSVDTTTNTNSSSTATTLADGIEPDDDDNNDAVDNDANNHDTNSTNLAAKKSTIMKWLENSDLNQKEGSFDIMKAICNESDSSDESENNDLEEKCTATTASSSLSSVKFANKLELVARNLAQFESELANGNVPTTAVENGNQQLENGSHHLLQQSVALLRDALNEITKQGNKSPSAVQSSPSQLQVQDTLKNDEDCIRQAQAIADYQNEIRKLHIQLEDKESTAASTMDTLHTECASLKDKITELTKDIDGLRDEKDALQKVIAENKSNTAKSIIDVADSNASATSSTELSFDKLIEEDIVAMNNAAVIHEEELILYKDRFGKTQAENLKLKREIAELKLKSDDFYNAILKKSLTYGVVFVALIVYFIFSYF